MPIYEYHCTICAEKIEKIRKISERDEPVECTALMCEGIAERSVTAPGYVHGGFYDNHKGNPNVA
ncbi:FmdB-like transcriptional regulator [Escherichia phage EcS1]|uniref:FmdB family regulatory protein n=1 Tax=Escherichia phage EcS1 TaxID=2083276 RepID=A0A2Z5ZC68_9CAUD|nr:FmdB-like transcriptional regulator [Escherichia phage EcS1]BBC78057.1 FmdB family regulatory protein [Escherichia phage EcS1]